MKIKESVLTEYVRKDLEAIGYTTYAEVSFRGGASQRADMFARIEDKDHQMYGMTIAFEAKLTFNLKVLEQAYFWKSRAHEVYIIVPATYKNMSSRRFARELCKMLGIGVMEVNLNRDSYNITVKPVRCDKPKVPQLYEEQKGIIASNDDNNFMTPFKVTVKRLNDFMQDKDAAYLIDVCNNIKHHYKGTAKATRNIRAMIEKNVISNFYITKESGKIVVRKRNGF
jgi:hypothetical protein